MRRIFWCGILAICYAWAGNLSDSCNKKISDFNKQIAIAEQFGNSDKLTKLKATLAQVKEQCNTDAKKALQDEIAKYESEIASAKSAVESAKQSGKTIKAKAEQVKLQTLESKLEKAKNELLSFE